MQHLEGSGTPVLYIGRMVLRGWLDPEDVMDTLEKKNLCCCWVRTAISVAPSACRSHCADCAVPSTITISRFVACGHAFGSRWVKLY
jgi:hypothetical protein